MKLDWVTALLADPPPANSTDDTDTHPIIYVQPNFLLYGKNYQHASQGKIHPFMFIIFFASFSLGLA